MKYNARQYDAVIVGAGASGMMAAICAARGGAKILLLEGKNEMGKKICATGNGRCNLSNQDQARHHYRCRGPAFVDTALKAFGLDETLAFFEDLGVEVVSRDGYFYPYSMQARAVADVLRSQIRDLPIDVLESKEVEAVWQKKGGYEVVCDGQVYAGQNLVIATGSAASDFAYGKTLGERVARDFGLRWIRTVPALGPLRVRVPHWNLMEKIRCRGRVSLLVDSVTLATDTGEIQMTSGGISGIPVFQISAMASRGLSEGKSVEILIDFYPDVCDCEKDAETGRTHWEEFCDKRYDRCKDKKLKEYFTGMLHERVSAFLIRSHGLDGEMRMCDLDPGSRRALESAVRETRVTVVGDYGFERAQTVNGGVDVNELEPLTMEVKRCPGLFFAGEILDVQGDCGGYNLQWAWTSGAIAGHCVAARRAYEGDEAEREITARSSKARSDAARDGKAHGNQARGGKAHGNQARDGKAHGNQARGGKAHGNQVRRGKARGDQARGKKAKGGRA